MDSEKTDLSQLSAIVGGFAHEIRNPLSTVSLNLKLLAEEWREPANPAEERAKKRVAILQQEVNRLQNILDEFLRIARPPALDRQPGDMNRLLRSLVPFVEPELKRRGIAIRLYCDHSIPLIQMDGDRVRQALLNLVLNAQHALEEQEDGEIALTTQVRGENLVVSIIDNGPGIRPELLDRIFKAWYSTRPDGSGLGLPIARRIITEHGGDIRVQSELGRGTRFDLIFPPAAGQEKKP